ncbi:MAG: hypothetical protein HQK50_12945, partial [Oligoflexia bacterium]|nr:hypothetical protein [Oligoflexia bacterium]
MNIKNNLFFLLFIITTFETNVSHALISANVIEQAIGERISRVHEFNDIRNKCIEMQVHCYLFGGTAAAYAHYVHRDLEHKLENKEYNPHRFDYDLTSMFNSSQDYDIVMDGTPEQTNALQAYLEKKFPYMQDQHTAWEVRPLRMQNGTKEAILGPNYELNTDFLKQHTDSNSQGIIEITDPSNDSNGSNGSARVHDLKTWNQPSKERMFLNDIANNQIHYLENPEHTKTARYQDPSTGNPQLFSVIRYLIKVLQYGVTIPEEDRLRLSKIIADFDPKSIKEANQYQKNWIEFNGKKLMVNSLDVERSADLLGGKFWGLSEDNSLRNKLSSLGLSEAADGLKWWVNKAPLRSTHPCGSEGGDKAGGKRAKDLGISKINHVVKEMSAFENILRPYDKAVNALISRSNVSNEAASYGDGFYVSTGNKDFYQSGMMIALELDANAVQGVDFEVAHDNPSIVIIKNKDCIHRDFEKEKGISLQDYVMKVLYDNLGDGKGYISRIDRKMESTYLTLSPQERIRLQDYAAQKIPATSRFPHLWFTKKLSSYFPQIVEALLEKGTEDVYIASWVLNQKHWTDHPEWVEALIKKGTVDKSIATSILSQAHWKDHPEWVEALIKKGKADSEIANYVLPQKHWKDHPELVEALIKKGTVDREMALVISRKRWKDHPEWVKALIENGKAD